MKRNNKKGFTIVELVVVIAVIAILAAVLIPTFGGITAKANDSARDQMAKNAHTNYLADCAATAIGADLVIAVTQGDDTYYYAVVDGQIKLTTETKTPADAITAAFGLTGKTLIDTDKYTFTNSNNAVANTVIYTTATGTAA